MLIMSSVIFVAITKIPLTLSLREKCPYSEFFSSEFSCIHSKCGPEKFRIWTLFKQCLTPKFSHRIKLFQLICSALVINC